jgi:hypothetical protein
MAPRHLDIVTLRPWPINSGKREVVRTDHRKRIGFMPPNNCDPALTPVDPPAGDHECPKCGVEMEPIEIGVEGLPLQELQLCPGCYLVTWSDQDGPHVRQGVPVKKGVHSFRDPGWAGGEPEEC